MASPPPSPLPVPPPPFILCETAAAFSNSCGAGVKGTGAKPPHPQNDGPPLPGAGGPPSHPIAVGEHGVEEAVQVAVQTLLATRLPKFPVCWGTGRDDAPVAGLRRGGTTSPAQHWGARGTMPYREGGMAPWTAAWGLSRLGEEALHPNPSRVPAPCKEGGCPGAACAHWVPDPPPRTPTLASASTHPAWCPCFPHDLSLPRYLRPAVPAAALGPLPRDEEAGLLLGEAPEQLEVGDEVQDVVVAGQLGPLGTCLHGHGPATPALRQPPADRRMLRTGTGCQLCHGSMGTPCP